MCFSRSAVGQPKKGRYRYLYPLKLPNPAKTANRSLDFNVKRYPSDSILRTIPLDLVVESWVKIDNSSDNTSGQLLGQIFGFDSSNNTSKLIPLTIPLNLYYHYSIALQLRWSRLLLLSSTLQFGCVETILSSLRSAASVSSPSVVASLLYVSQLRRNSLSLAPPLCGTPTWLLSLPTQKLRFMWSIQC